MSKLNQKVSIIIPTKDRTDLLPHAIEAALRQTYHNIDVIVVDDSETQSAREVVETIAKKNSCVKYFVNPGNGGNAARNKGIIESDAEIIAFCDDDDVFRSDKVETQLNYLINKDLDIVYCSSRRIFHTDQRVTNNFVYTPPCPPSWIFLPYLLAYSFISTQTILCTKKCIETFGYFDVDIPKGQDWDFCINLAINKCKFGRIPEPLVDINVHDGTRVSSLNSNFLDMILLKYKREYRSILALLFFVLYCIKWRNFKRLKHYFQRIFFHYSKKK